MGPSGDDNSPLIAGGAPVVDSGMQRNDPHPHTMASIQMGTSPTATCFGILLCPATVLCSWWVLEPRTEALILHYGQLSDKVDQPGCHFHNCVGRELRTISVAQLSVDLPVQKITDVSGNPILISAVLTYRFNNASFALLNVQEPQTYVVTQAQAALKQVVGRYSYSELKSESAEIGLQLVNTLQPRVDTAGALIMSFNLNELNYAPEIAAQMLKKQSAQALVEARHLIVKGAVDIAREALANLEAGGMKLSDEEKVKIVSSLLIVTTSDKETTPTLSV